VGRNIRGLKKNRQQIPQFVALIILWPAWSYLDGFHLGLSASLILIFKFNGMLNKNMK